LKKSFTVFITFLCFLSIDIYSSDTLNVAVHEFCPFLCEGSKENGKEGYVVEILRDIYEKEGYQLHFHVVSYEEGILGTERGEYDLMPMLNVHSSDKMILSKKTCAALVQNFYVLKGKNWEYNGIESLQDSKIGTILGYNYSILDTAYEAYLQENSRTESPTVFYVDTDNSVTTIIEMMKKGEITTFNECSFIVDYLLKKMNLTEEFKIAGSLGTLNNYIGFSPKRTDSEKLSEMFDTGIQELRKTGKLDSILNCYHLKDWEIEK